MAEVARAKLAGNVKTLETDLGTVYAKAVIIATGARHRHLGLEEEEQLVGTGRGILRGL